VSCAAAGVEGDEVNEKKKTWNWFFGSKIKEKERPLLPLSQNMFFV
jgi:hypothetical protein